MPSITNVGGSLTSAAVLTLLAWGVRFFRAAAQRKRQQAISNADQPAKTGRHFCWLSPAALLLLVRTKVAPFSIYDVRSRSEADAQPLPEELHCAVSIPAQELQQALAFSGAQNQQEKQRQARKKLICLVGQSEAQMCAGAAAAAAAACQYTAVLQGGLAAFEAADLAQAEVPRIGRHALALLLGRGCEPAGGQPVCCIDVRRPDERTLYGSIAGSLHIPLEHLPHALQCSPEQFETDHSGPQPAHGHGWVVLCSRRERRAAWAAQVAADVGFNCLILRQGVCGWKLHPAVQGYDSYGPGEAPPEPDTDEVDDLDEHLGYEELLGLGILSEDQAGQSARQSANDQGHDVS